MITDYEPFRVLHFRTRSRMYRLSPREISICTKPHPAVSKNWWRHAIVVKIGGPERSSFREILRVISRIGILLESNCEIRRISRCPPATRGSRTSRRSFNDSLSSLRTRRPVFTFMASIRWPRDPPYTRIGLSPARNSTARMP